MEKVPGRDYAMKDKASTQLAEFKKSIEDKGPQVLTTGSGAPVANLRNSLSVGPRGPLLLQDALFLENMAHFDRERVPERVVHAKGTGAFGYFEVTDDITKYSKACVFSEVGKRTPILVRFSAVTTENGSADTTRDPRGFAIKFYTEEGNWDLVGNNTPIFFIRDAMLFPSLIHSMKRNPRTNLKDMNAFWDFLSLRPESTHQVSFQFADRGIPFGFRHMHGFGSNTFKLVNAEGNPVYCKFHYLTDQGIKNLTNDEAEKLAGRDPDYGVRDLFNAIADGHFPTWTFHIQVMTFEEAEKFRWNPFDVTKIWPHEQFPLIRVGKLVLNQNPTNFFTQVEQLAFNPANMIPGIEPSPDKILQGRLFSYADTQRHRIGGNFLHVPVNTPMNVVRRDTFRRAGPMNVTQDHDGAPNYFPNSFSGPKESGDPNHVESVFSVSGDVKRHEDPTEDDDDHFCQARVFWKKVLNDEERKRLAENIAGHLMHAEEFIQERAIGNFSKVDEEYGRLIKESIQARMKMAAE